MQDGTYRISFTIENITKLLCLWKSLDKIKRYEIESPKEYSKTNMGALLHNDGQKFFLCVIFLIVRIPWIIFQNWSYKIF